MSLPKPIQFAIAALLGALLGGILGGWIAMAVGLVLVPLILWAVSSIRRQITR